jgi:tetratricopeptide (TPR) repeat protein
MEEPSLRDRWIVGIGLALFAVTIILSVVKPVPLVPPVLPFNEDNPQAHLRRGNRFLAAYPGMAIPNYSRAIELDPGFVVAYYQRAQAYYRVGNVDAAFADMDTVIALAPDEPEYIFSRANMYRKAGEQQAAIADYNAAIALDPKYAVAYYNRANAYYDLDRLADALEDYRTFLNLYGRRDLFSAMAYERIDEIGGS